MEGWKDYHCPDGNERLERWASPGPMLELVSWIYIVAIDYEGPIF